MVRDSKLTLGLAVVLISGGIGLAYSGAVSGIVSPEQLPGPPPTAVGLIVGVVIVAILLSGYLDRRAWKATGSAVGLTSGGARFHSEPSEDGGSSFFGEPTLSGTVDGRPVRARTYSTGGGKNSSSTTYTVVEAQLQTPVEWTATFGVAGDSGPADHELDAVETRAVSGVDVRGDVPDGVADDVVTAQVAETLSSLDGEVSVGGVKSSVVGGMMDALDDADDSMGASFAKGMLDMASDGEDGPSRTVEIRERGLLLDERELEARIDAITTVADAVERASSTAA